MKYSSNTLVAAMAVPIALSIALIAEVLQDPIVGEPDEIEVVIPDDGQAPNRDWRPTVWSSDGWGVWHSLEGRTLEQNTWQDIRVKAPRRHAWSSHNVSDALTPFRLRRVYVEGNDDGPFWGARLYNVSPGIVRDCEFTEIGAPNTSVGEGHALYWNLWGNAQIVDTLFHDLLGQAVQIVWRDTETRLLGQPGGRITLERLRVRDAATGAGRGAYPVSIFNPGQEVYVHRVSIWSTRRGTPEWWNHRTQEVRRSRGGFGCFWGDGGRATPRLVVRRLNVFLIDPDRPAVKLAGVGEVDWDGGWIAADDRTGRPAQILLQECPTGSIKNVKGDYVIVHDGEVVATNEDYEW